MRSLGVSTERIERVKARVNDIRLQWEAVRRPSRPAGPGRPRGHKRPTWETNGNPAAESPIGDSAAASSEGPKKAKKKTVKEPSAKGRGPKEDGKAVLKVAALPAIPIPAACKPVAAVAQKVSPGPFCLVSPSTVFARWPITILTSKYRYL